MLPQAWSYRAVVVKPPPYRNGFATLYVKPSLKRVFSTDVAARFATISP